MSTEPSHHRYPPLIDEPRIAARGVEIVRWDGETQSATRARDELSEEEPLEIRVRGRSISITMRTPGHDVELAAGFLLSEGLLAKREDVYAAEHCGANDEPNVLNVLLGPDVAVDFDALTRHVFASSSCGLCGKATIDSVRSRLPAVTSAARVAAAAICAMPDAMRSAQLTFDHTGGLHAAALFDVQGRLLVLREDVGRHNAVDKVIGHALLRGWFPLESRVLLVSGRSSFEIVQKALAARIPTVAAVSAPSSLAVELAGQGGQTLIGFLRGSRMNVYTNPQRIDFGDAPVTEPQ